MILLEFLGMVFIISLTAYIILCIIEKIGNDGRYISKFKNS